MQYKCIKNFTLYKYDNNGYKIKNSYTVEAGTVWAKHEYEFETTSVRLERVVKEEVSYIVIAKEIFEANFEELEV